MLWLFIRDRYSGLTCKRSISKFIPVAEGETITVPNYKTTEAEIITETSSDLLEMTTSDSWSTSPSPYNTSRRSQDETSYDPAPTGEAMIPTFGTPPTLGLMENSTNTTTVPPRNKDAKSRHLVSLSVLLFSHSTEVSFHTTV